MFATRFSLLESSAQSEGHATADMLEKVIASNNLPLPRKLANIIFLRALG